jgi:hypothetical protein
MKFSETGLFLTPCNDWEDEDCPNYKNITQQICCHECQKEECYLKCDVAESYETCIYLEEDS